jgi:hypothetical protein
MKDLNKEYYVLYPDNNQNYPMIRSSLSPKARGRLVDEDNYQLKIYNHTIMPSKPEYVDYHTSGGSPVISFKFVTALKELNLYGAQSVKGNKGDVIEEMKLEYYLLHIYNFIISMDLKKSIYDFNERIQSVSDVEKFTLDSEKLSQIPLEKRLVFRMKEYGVYNMFHQSVVDHLNKFDLKGMRFIPVTSWNDNAHFN